MKYWFLAVLEKGEKFNCSKCGAVMEREMIAVETQLYAGGLPNIDEPHFHPTGKKMCLKCAEAILI